MENRETKRCPYCGEEILAVAKKCRYCGEWLDEPSPQGAGQQTRPSAPAETSPQPDADENNAGNFAEEEPQDELPGWIEYFFWQPFFKHYFDFKSSIGRKRFWVCMLWIALFANAILGAAFLLADKNLTFLDTWHTLSWIFLVFLVVELAIAIPALALYVRRLRDADLAWKWVLTMLIPYIGPVILIVKLCQPGESQCRETKAAPIDYIAIAVCSILIVFGYSKGLPYLYDTAKMWQKNPLGMSSIGDMQEGADTLTVDTMDVEGSSIGDDYAWLCERYAEPEELENRSGSELRVMRNYIFARHGYIFESADLRQYFSQFDWYTPVSRNVVGELSEIERHNVKWIEMYEQSCSEAGADDRNPYFECYLRCKGKFVDDGTPVELAFSVDEDGNFSDGSVIVRQNDLRYDGLTGHLSGNHLETFASLSVSLYIVGDGKMTGTVDGRKVSLRFTAQYP